MARDHWMSVKAGTQRRCGHCGNELPRNPSEQGRGQVAHGVLQEKSFGHNPRTCRKLRNLVEKSKSSGPTSARCFVAQRDESACTRAGTIGRLVCTPSRSAARGRDGCVGGAAALKHRLV